MPAIYDRNDPRDDRPRPLLLLAFCFAMLTAGCAVLGLVVGWTGVVPTRIAVLPAALLLPVSVLLAMADRRLAP